MSSALLWKEWRQLRGLRWVGAGLGVLLPVVALSAPSAARQGFIPFVDLSRAYSASEVILGALPLALGLGLWPLLALLTTAESFCGDRAAGTERFLLERPVTRPRIWSMRALASMGSTLVTVAASGAVWAVLAVSIADPSPEEWATALRHLGTEGGLTTLACLLSGMLAAALLGSPLAAVLLAVVLVAAPAWVGALLSGWAPYASFGQVPVGVMIPAFLVLVVYPLGSHLASCGGEPAGRGRVARGVVTLGAGTVLVLALFVVAAATAVRVVARQFDRGAIVVASPAGGVAFAGSEGGWLVDLARAEPVRFLPPPVWDATWSPAGDRLAVATMSGPLGSLTPSVRVEFLDPRGQPAGRTITLSGQAWLADARWVGSRLVLLEIREAGPGGRLVVYDPAIGTMRSEPLAQARGSQLVGPTDEGRLFLAGFDPGAPDGEGERGRPFRVRAVDLDTATLAGDPLVEDVGHPWSARHSLSPTGRFWVTQRRDPAGSGRRVCDLATGSEHVVDLSGPPVWVRGDRLVWAASDGTSNAVMMARPGEAAVELRRFDHAEVHLEGSPDRRRLLVNVADVMDREGSVVTRRRSAGSFVLDLDTGEWTELAVWPAEVFTGFGYATTWAGPGTVARTGPGTLALEDVATPGKLRVVFER